MSTRKSTALLSWAVLACLNGPIAAAGVNARSAALPAKSDPSLGAVEGGLADFGVTARQSRCITPLERASASQTADANAAMFRALGLLPDASGETGSRRAPGTALFDFYPQAGNLYSDLFHNNYVDLDASSGIRDYLCSNHTYNGHKGHDSDLRSFFEQRIGVPVFSALPGVVTNASDGAFDESTTLTPKAANFVIVDHSAVEPGLRTLYWHLKNGSVRVGIGDQVVAGQELGLTASSGYSTGPHLHFEVQKDGVPFETMEGPCGPSSSRWAEQWSRPTDHAIRDFGVHRNPLPGGFSPPEGFPRHRHLTFNETLVSYWMQGYNLPAGSTYRFRWYRPNGSIAADTGTNPIGFSSQFYRGYWAYFTWNVPEMRQVAGDWRVQIDINSEQAISVPLTVKPADDPGFNRAPSNVTGAFDPPSPSADDVIFFRLSTDLVEDDADFDVVSYRYRWLVDGAAVRDVVSAAHADALPAIASMGGGSTVEIEVTPTDGELSASTFGLAVDLVLGCPADINGDGVVTGVDFTDFIIEFGQGSSKADINGDGVVTGVDFTDFIIEFGAGCS